MIDTTAQIAPANLGMTEAEVVDAYHTKASIRYWPTIGKLCHPHIGRAHGLAVVGRASDGLELGLRIEGKAGWVLASHCEVVSDV